MTVIILMKKFGDVYHMMHGHQLFSPGPDFDPDLKDSNQFWVRGALA